MVLLLRSVAERWCPLSTLLTTILRWEKATACFFVCVCVLGAFTLAVIVLFIIPPQNRMCAGVCCGCESIITPAAATVSLPLLCPQKCFFYFWLLWEKQRRVFLFSFCFITATWAIISYRRTLTLFVLVFCFCCESIITPAAATASLPLLCPTHVFCDFLLLWERSKPCFFCEKTTMCFLWLLWETRKPCALVLHFFITATRAIAPLTPYHRTETLCWVFVLLCKSAIALAANCCARNRRFVVGSDWCVTQGGRDFCWCTTPYPTTIVPKCLMRSQFCVAQQWYTVR